MLHFVHQEVHTKQLCLGDDNDINAVPFKTPMGEFINSRCPHQHIWDMTGFCKHLLFYEKVIGCRETEDYDLQ